MAKKDENFDFDTESEGKGKFDLVGFFKNLTKKQKGIIVGASIGVLILIVVCVILFGSGLFGNNPDHSDIITDIYITSKPQKTVYQRGEEVDYSGLVISVVNLNFDIVYVSYDEDPEDFKISGFDSSIPMEDQVITVSYKGFTTSFKIDIKPDPNEAVHLVKIELSSMPRTEGKVEDFPSVKGGMILCTYSDGSTKEVKLTIAHTTGFSKVTAPGEYTIRVEYWDGDRCATTEYTITVTE